MGATVSIAERKTAITNALQTKENPTALTKINVTGLPTEMEHVITYHCTCSNVDWYTWSVSCRTVTLPFHVPFLTSIKRESKSQSRYLKSPENWAAGLLYLRILIKYKDHKWVGSHINCHLVHQSYLRHLLERVGMMSGGSYVRKMSLSGLGVRVEIRYCNRIAICPDVRHRR